MASTWDVGAMIWLGFCFEETISTILNLFYIKDVLENRFTAHLPLLSLGNFLIPTSSMDNIRGGGMAPSRTLDSCLV